MKPISSPLQTHLASEVTTLATCWKLTRRDGVVLGFTSHDRDISYLGVTYLASAGFVPQSVASNCDLSVDNMDIEGVIDSEIITEEDIQAGLYDFAEIEIFMVNYKDTSQGALNLRAGWIGEVKYGKGRFLAEVRGLMQSLTQGIGELYSPSCRALLGDSRCKVDMEDFTVTGTVTAVTDNQIFSDSSRTEEAGYFNMGKITFTSGENEDVSLEVKEYGASGVIILVFPLPYALQAGDAYTMEAGCDKSFDTCTTRFANAINFRGEPHIPGLDKVLRVGGGG